MSNFFTISLLLLLVFTQCKNANNKINITQKETTKNIIIRTASDDKKSVITLQFPRKIFFYNNTLTNVSFLTIKYQYNENIPPERKSGFGLSLFKNENNNLIRKKNNKKTILESKSKLEYVYYTRHFVDSARSIQDQFKPYIEKMLSEHKDTLHIGTVKEFKAKHAELFKRLTKDDSISIQFLDGKELGERITVPVKW